MIRPLTAADAPCYWPLRLRALREEPESFASSFEEQRERPLEEVTARLRVLTAGDNFVLGAFAAEELLGIVALNRETALKERHKGHVYQMYVAPEVRGQGHGRRLLEELIARARRVEGLEQLLLDVVTTRVAARRLYARLGFEPYGLERRAMKLPDGTSLDSELMVCWLHGPTRDAAPRT